MIAATANILKSLTDTEAERALDKIESHNPSLISLQEWGRDRRALLSHDTYEWSSGMPVGVRKGWGDLLASRTVIVSRERRDVRASRATEALVLDKRSQLHAILNVHLIAHHDRAANFDAWRDGIEWITEWVRELAKYKPKIQPWVMGDVNKHNLRIPGLISCWKTNRLWPTFHRRTIDGIWTDQLAAETSVIKTPSDHHSVMAVYRG